jgi:hypothetical protein
MTTQLSEAFLEIANLGFRLGIESINKLPGCWEHQVDQHWWIAVNGHKEPIVCSAGATVLPYSAYVQFNGWPTGLIDPSGGIFAAGEAANEDNFINALKNAAI